MVVISSLSFDATTSEVLSWLRSFNQAVTRINNDQLTKESLNFLLESGNNLKSIWYRKYGTSYIISHDHDIPKGNLVHAKDELNVLKEALLDIQQCYKLGENGLEHNKLKFLKVAQEEGISIPPFIVTSKKSEVIQFIKTHGATIIKPVGEGVRFLINNKIYKIYTELINQHVNRLPEVFFPTLFQKCILKKYEIRTLYLEGNIYSMAIFSQLNTKTQIDMRHYDHQNPNRLVPFTLPDFLEKKIKEVMKRLNLTIGVFDIIRSLEGEYIFLEVNPCGQFGDLSLAGNYYIEKKIAQLLSK